MNRELFKSSDKDKNKDEELNGIKSICWNVSFHQIKRGSFIIENETQSSKEEEEENSD